MQVYLKQHNHQTLHNHDLFNSTEVASVPQGCHHLQQWHMNPSRSPSPVDEIWGKSSVCLAKISKLFDKIIIFK